MIAFSIEDKLNTLGTSLDTLSDSIRESFAAGVVQIAKAAQNEWARLAQDRLKTSREIYVNGLRQAESFKLMGTPDDPRAEITLVGTMPNNFEFGMPSFDMKTVRPGWLGGGKVKTAKDGHKYAIIPFRHSTGNDTRFGYTGKAAAISGPDLKTQLRAAVRTYGLDRALTASVGEVATRRIPRTADVHQYLKGLQKTEVAGSDRHGNVKRSGQLNTFRVISEKSKPDAWIHPGLKPANLLQEVEGWVDNALDDLVESLLA